MPTLSEIKDALDQGLMGTDLRKKLHLYEDSIGPLFPHRTYSPTKTTLKEHMKGMVPLLPTREPNSQSFRNSPEHNPEPNNRALEVPVETFIHYLDRHEKSEVEKFVKNHLEELESFYKGIAEEIAAGRIEDPDDYEEIYAHGSPYDGFDHELTQFDHRLTKLGLIDYRKEWNRDAVLLPVPYVLNEWLENIAQQYRPDAFVGFGGYVEIPEPQEPNLTDPTAFSLRKESTSLQEQVHEDDQWEEEDEGISYSPFTKKEIAILNFLAKNFTKEDLIQITTSTDLYPYSGNIGKRWKDAMKLFGHTMPEGWGEMEPKAEASKYAKWALDNWDEEIRGEDGEMDYSKVTKPIKVLPKWYNVNYEETVSQVEFKSGDVDLIAFDEDDALNKGNREFFDWGGNTDVDDYGDSERFEHETTSAEYKGLAEEIKKLIKEQPLTEQDRNKDSWTDEEAEGMDRSAFTPVESKILNTLKSTFTRNELSHISTNTFAYGGNQLAKRWVDLMKLFGIKTSPGTRGMEQRVDASKYAKWASDNWDFAEDLGDYSKIKAPFKELPKWYNVDYEETVDQTEYRRGSVEIMAFDEDDAYERGRDEFYDWNGEVDTYDYGEHEIIDSEISDVTYQGLAESTSSRRTDEEITQFLNDNYKDKFLKLYNLYTLGKEHGEKLVGGVSDASIKQFLKEVQFILYSNRRIPQWTGQSNVWDYTGDGYIPWDRSPFGRMSLHSTVIKWVQNLLLEDILSKEEHIKNAYEWLDTQFPTVVPNEYYPFGEGQFTDAIRSITHIAGLTWHEAQIVVDNFWREKRNAGKITASGKNDRLDEDKKRTLTKGLLEEEEHKKMLFNEDSDFPNINPAKSPNQLKKIYAHFKESLFNYWDNKGPHNDPHILKLLGLDTRKERGLYKIIDEWLVEWHGGREKAIEVAQEKLKGIQEVWDGGYDFKYVVTSIDEKELPWNVDQKKVRKERGWSVEDEIGVFVIVDGGGMANLALGGHDTYTLWDIFHDHQWWSDGDYEEECRTCGLRRSVRDESEDDLTRANRVSDEPDEALKEEVRQEIVEVLEENITDLLNATGIGVNYVTVKGATRPDHFPPKEYIHEAADMFGQGLLEPIELQPYDTEEEWEEDVAKIEIPDDDEETDYEDEYEYEGSETDPESGFVAPSRDVTENICNVKGFCKAQGPITFGQLKALVEAATNKRIASDIGRGVFKSLWRIIPFFLPQVLFAAVGITATRALNKIVTPALKDTKGYKRWWGKVVLKAMDIAEGDYIPDVALGDDPLSKIFFVSDGLLEMIRDKYKLKFARYVADVAAAQPDDEPVPDWFVENLLRDYLNQKFLLDPPLGPKHGVDIKKTLREQREQGLSDKSTILIDGTSSAGKSWVSKELKAVPFHKATDPNQWVIIASDDFNGYTPENEERRLAFDPPSIRDWAKGHDFGITSGLYRKAGEDVPPNPKENEYVGGPNANAAAWYMAQEFKTGKWNKVIFDDVTNDILKYVPNIKHNILLHAPIYMLINNIVGRNEVGKEDPDWREPTKALDQYLEKYEATKEKPDENKGDPSTELTKNGLKGLLSQSIDDENYIDGFISDLGIKDDGVYYIKVKDKYLTPNTQLINVDSDRIVYLDKFKEIVKTDTNKDIKKTLREQREEEVSPVLKSGDIIRPIDIPERKEQTPFGTPTPFALYWVWHPSYGTPKKEGDYIVITIEDLYKLQQSGYLEKFQDTPGLPGHLHRHLKVLSRDRDHQWLKVELSDEERAKYKDNAKRKLRGDVLQEQEEREISPPLEPGDMIKIIEKTDKDSYLNLWDEYVVLTPLWHDGSAEGWIVTGEGDKGWDKRQVYGYVVMRLDLLVDFNDANLHQDMIVNGHKWLKIGKYEPSIAHLQEERQKNPSPDLEEGDEIIVLHVDGTHENEPETFIPYKVIKRVREPRTKGKLSYHIEPMSGRFPYWDDEKERWEVENWDEKGKRKGLWTMTTKIIYEVGDEWIFRPGFKREEEEILNEESQPISRPTLKVGDVIKLIDNAASGEVLPYWTNRNEQIVDDDGYVLNDGELLELFVNYVVEDIVYNNEAPTGRKRIQGDPWKGEIKGDIWGYGISREERKRGRRQEWEKDGKEELKASGPYQWIIVNKEEEILQEQEEKVNPPIDVGDTVTVIAHEDPDVEYMTDDEIKEFMENQDLQDTLEGDWHNFEETAELMGYTRWPGKGWYHKKELNDQNPDLFVPYRIVQKVEIGWKEGDVMRYLLLTLPEVEEHEDEKREIWASGRVKGLDYRWLYPSEEKYIISPPTPKSLQEHQEKVNPYINVGDTITVVAYEDPDVEYMTDDEIKEFMENQEVKDTLQGDWHNYEETAELMGFKWHEGRGWYHRDDIETHTTQPDLFVPYRIIQKTPETEEHGRERAYGKRVEERGKRYLLLPLSEINKWKKSHKKGGYDFRWLYPNEVRYIMSPTPPSLQEQDSKKVEVNPPLKPGDKIKVIDVDEDSDQRREFMNGMQIITSERFPKLYHTYTVIDENEEMKWSTEGRGGGSPRYGWTRGYEGSGLDIDEGTQLLWLLMDKKDEDELLRYTEGRRVGYKVIAPYFDKWVKVEDPEVLQEHTKDKLNPQLMIGDEILVLQHNQPEGASFNPPEIYVPYVVVKIKESIKNNTFNDKYVHYEIERKELTPEEMQADLRAGGGWRRLTHLYPNDTWMLRPDSRGEELNEQSQDKVNPQLMIGDEIMVIESIGWRRKYTTGGRKPDLYEPYVVTAIKFRQPENWEGPDADLKYYEIEPIGLTDEDKRFGTAVNKWMGREKRIYPTDTWIYNPTFRREELNEQDFPFNRDNKKQELDHPKGEPPWSIRRGKQHYAMNVDPTPQEPVTALNNYLVKNSPFNFLGFDYYLSTVPGNMPGEARIDVYVPVLDDSVTADNIWKDILKFYKKKEEYDDWGNDIVGKLDDPYSMEEIPMRDIGYHAKWPDFYRYEEDFAELHPEAVEDYNRRDSDYINPDGKVYETSWRERFNTLKDEMKELAKLFGLENAVINRDPGHPWKRQQDSYGSQDIRPGTDIPYSWPRESDEIEWDEE